MVHIIDIMLVGCAIILAIVFDRARRHSRFIQNELQDILDSLEPIALKDAQGRLIRVNQSFADSYDRDFSDLLGYRTEDVGKGPNAESDLHPILDELRIADDHTVQRFSTYGPMGKVVYDVERYIMHHNSDQETYLEIRHNVTRLFRIQEVLQRQKDQLEERSRALFDSNQELVKIRQALEINLEEKEHEYELAREVQQGLLPLHFPEYKAFDFWSHYEPVSDVGGDLYDVIPLGAQKFGIFIGDVSGHGVPAAFVGALAKMSLMVHAEKTPSPKDLFRKMNSDLNKVITSGHYLTAFYGVLDLFDNSFVFTRASHPHPIVVHADGSETPLDSKGLFLGAFSDGRYEENQIKLEPEDRVFFFTDGCYEMEAKRGGHLSYKHFRDSLMKFSRGELGQIYGSTQTDLMKRVRSGWENEDDQTFLTLQINKMPRLGRLKYLLRFENASHIRRARFYNKETFSKFLDQFKEILEHQYNKTVSENVGEALKEVVFNAIEYGHKGMTHQAVVVAYQLLDSSVKLAVHDKGPGFDIEELSTPSSPQERGYGILIVKTYMDEVYYDQAVSTFTMTKFI